MERAFKEEITRRHLSGESVHRIAMALKIDKNQIRRYLIDAGLKEKGWSRRKKVHLDRNQIVELYKKGLSQRDIAVELGSHQPTISRVLRSRPDGLFGRNTLTK
jgi:lambda repressor-like predicted transcriptional regulator